ncbi:DUF192 domain-containing protein [Candidatus Woesearchaeota archaeon]|nr:DUF192 domain-containing protein [Candidatus Woesearchaeota archaeon]
MPIQNATKGTVLAETFAEARTWKEQFMGLMFKPVSPLVFVFDKEQKVDLHSWFCKGAIDLVFLNDEWEVVELFRELSPWRMYRSKNKALFLLELPAGTVFKSRTEIGDVIQLLHHEHF